MKFIPDNNQFYTLFYFICLKLNVARPHKILLDYFQDLDQNDLCNPSFVFITSITLPLTVIGSKQLYGFIYILRYCPLLKSLDLSNLPDLFSFNEINESQQSPIDLDNFFKFDNSFGSSPNGYQIIELICSIALHHPSLEHINLRSHSIGVQSIKLLQSTITQRPYKLYIEIDGDSDYVTDYNAITDRINGTKRSNSSSNTSKLESCEFSELASLQTIDRKTMDDKAQLILLMNNHLCNISVLSTEQVSRAIQNSKKMSITDAVARCCRAYPLNTEESGDYYSKVSTIEGDGLNLFLIHTGSVKVTCGSNVTVLMPGAYWGESLRPNPYSHRSSNTMDWQCYHMGILKVNCEGTVYCIPWKDLADWREYIELQSMQYFHILRYIPSMQSLPLWLLNYVSHSISVLDDHPALIINKGEQFKGLFVILSGCVVTVDKSVHSTETIFDRLDYIGEQALFTSQSQYLITFQFKSKSGNRILHIPSNYFYSYLFDALKLVLKAQTLTYTDHSLIANNTHSVIPINC